MSALARSPGRRNVPLSPRNSHDYIHARRKSAEPELQGEIGTAVQALSRGTESALSISLRKGSLSKADQEIIALIQHVPQKTCNPCLENYHLYPIAQKVYQAVTSKMLPSELGVDIQDRSAKRKVYQLVFDTLYREPIVVLCTQ